MKVAFLLPLVLCGAPAFAARDVLSPLPPGAVKLTGGLKADVDNSIVHWHKGKVPYHAFAEFFRRGRPQFALGEMWGKFVRSGAMQYRHASDPELQPDDKGGDLWERKYVQALRHGWEALEFARHRRGQQRFRAPVEADGRIHANLDVCQLGLGGASCGPKPLDKYIFPVRRERWRLLISPVNGTDRLYSGGNCELEIKH